MLNSAGFLLCSVGTDGIIGIVVGIVLALKSARGFWTAQNPMRTLI